MAILIVPVADADANADAGGGISSSRHRHRQRGKNTTTLSASSTAPTAGKRSFPKRDLQQKVVATRPVPLPQLQKRNSKSHCYII